MACWLPMMALLVSSASAQIGDVFKGFGGTITKEVAAIKDPIDKTATYVGFSQCKHVKKLIGVDYEQLLGEPDLSQLSLDFITSPSKNRDKHHKSHERDHKSDKSHSKSNDKKHSSDHKSNKRSRDDSRDHDRHSKKSKK